MTYIIGINMFGHTALIADTCQTNTNRNRNFETVVAEGAIKTNGLFPGGGCIYAISGRLSAAREFTERLRRVIQNERLMGQHAECWDVFTRLVNRYKFPSDADFQLLLSSRHAGIPALYLLDSRLAALQKCDEQIVTVGSGKDVLDDHLLEIHRTRMDFIAEQFGQPNVPGYYFPHLYCLWLMEFAHGAERDTLAKLGVGGVFHFTFQHSIGEARQGPAIYVITTAIHARRQLFVVPFRVCFASREPEIHELGNSGRRDALIVQRATKFRARQSDIADGLRAVFANAAGSPRFDTTVIFDPLFWPDIDTNPTAAKAMARELDVNSREPQANFVGFGFANLGYRKSFGYLAGPADEIAKHIDIDSGYLAPCWRNHIVSNFDISPDSVIDISHVEDAVEWDCKDAT